MTSSDTMDVFSSSLIDVTLDTRIAARRAALSARTNAELVSQGGDKTLLHTSLFSLCSPNPPLPPIAPNRTSKEGNRPSACFEIVPPMLIRHRKTGSVRSTNSCLLRLTEHRTHRTRGSTLRSRFQRPAYHEAVSVRHPETDHVASRMYSVTGHCSRNSSQINK